MNLTNKNIKELKNITNNPLTKRVCSYVINEWNNYEDKKNIFIDVLYHGCQSGVVDFLIYYSDTVAFYEKYRIEINELLSEELSSFGVYELAKLFGEKWDKEDPLVTEVHNKNLLAWFGFEETLRNIGCNFEALQECI